MEDCYSGRVELYTRLQTAGDLGSTDQAAAASTNTVRTA